MIQGTSGLTSIQADETGRPKLMRVIIPDLTTALTSPVVSGYTFKVVTHKVDRDGNVANSTAYYPSSAGTASWTVTCSADDSALTTTWWEPTS